MIFVLIGSYNCYASPQNNNSSPYFVAVDASGTLSVALMSNGSVWAWGESTAQLGPGNMNAMANKFDYDWTMVNSSVPVRLNISNVKSISNANHLILFLKDDGTVWAWGDNEYGQLGNGEYTDAKNDINKQIVQVTNLTDIIAVSAGNTHCLALKKDGTIWAWGSNVFGELGNGISSNGEFIPGEVVPVQVKGLSQVRSISAGYFYSIALTEDGSVWIWGNNGFQVGNNQTNLLPVKLSLSNVTSISAGLNDFSLALKDDGTVWAWGDINNGLFENNGNYLEKPIKIDGLSNIAAISAGDTQSMALDKDGTIWIRGENQMGQLGLGMLSGNDITTPVKVPGLTNIMNISTGNFYNLALSNDGMVWGWGINSNGQIGIGTNIANVLSPIVIVNGTSTSSTIASTSDSSADNNLTTQTTTEKSQSGNNTNNMIIIGALGIILFVSLISYLIMRYLRSS